MVTASHLPVPRGGNRYEYECGSGNRSLDASIFGVITFVPVQYKQSTKNEDDTFIFVAVYLCNLFKSSTAWLGLCCSKGLSLRGPVSGFGLVGAKTA